MEAQQIKVGNLLQMCHKIYSLLCGSLAVSIGLVKMSSDNLVGYARELRVIQTK